ncbi:MAG: hypothetical protein JNK58_00585 [Phycisphaerae bacterium]|nr:hypothetical protein [Phycisphaerae bacterium]
MKLRTRRRTSAAVVVALLAPILAFAVILFVSQAGPASAPASPAPTVAIAEPTSTLTKEQARAASWLASWTRPDRIESPMLYPTRRPQEAAPEAPAEAPAAEPAASIPEFVVKTVMGSGDRAMASINGKVYRVGDEPIPGWKIVSMDSKAKRVELSGPGGRTISIAPQGLPR